MRRIRLFVEYDGTDFCGWQRQDNGLAVQEVLERALREMTGEETIVRGAGRTDAGVHAKGQVAVFDTEKSIPVYGFQRGLNTLMPQSVSVWRADEVPLDFDPRHHTDGKIYRYQIWNNPSRSPLIARTSWYLPVPLDVERMQAAAKPLIGKHDFSAFRAADCERHNTVREMRRIEVRREGDLVTIDVEATAFLKNMVRIIVGTLVDAGRGKTDANAVRAILEGRDRTKAGQTAPPEGLMLLEVFYRI